MRPRTIGVVAVVLLILGTVVAYGVVEETSSEHELIETWVSEPPPSVGDNHHPPAATSVNGESYIVAPINTRNGTHCALTLSVLDGDGNQRWQKRIPAQRCFRHGVSDPTIADFDEDGQPEVIVTTTAQELVAYGLQGTVELRHPLTTYGYSKPLVSNLTLAPGVETVAVDLLGGVFVLRSNGTEAWTHKLDNTRVRQPAVRDFDADGTPELAVGQLAGDIVMFGHDGDVEWRNALSDVTTMRSLVTGQVDGDAAIELLVTTYAGDVIAVDGKNGRIEWRQTLDAQGATAHTLGDGDGDGDPELYVATLDGAIRSLDARDGSIEWMTTLTTETIASMPPPSLGDINGDGAPELVAVSSTGRVAVMDTETGDVLASYDREVPLKTFARVTDFDGDGTEEILVVYRDGRVVALSYT